MTLLEHLDAIEDMVKRKCRSDAEYLLMAGGASAAPAFGAAAYAGQAGVLHSNVFGNVYSGNNPFSVGHTGKMGQAGVLHNDIFENVFAGDSPFSVGNV